MRKYRINWRALETGNTGHGKPVFNTRAMAQLNADTLNKENEGITTHWVEPVEVEEELEEAS